MTRPVQSGRADARYMIVGEAIGGEEEEYGRPFIGTSGQELYRMLEESRWLPPGTAQRIISGLHTWYDPSEHRLRLSRPDFLPLDRALDTASLFITNVCHERPPGNDIENFFLKKTVAKQQGVVEVSGRYPVRPILDGIQQLTRDINGFRPTFILALGGTALWTLTGQTGITKWRGSILTVAGGPVGDFGIKVIPTFHPADILREWSHRFITVQDMRRALREKEFPEIRRPTWHFITRPSFAEAMEWLREVAAGDDNDRFAIVADIETPYGWRDLTGHIACIGFADSSTSAISIPLMCVDNVDGYWPADQETQIVLAIRRLMSLRDIVFHKGVFDVMHIIRHWGFVPRWRHDTMVMQHVLFPGLLGGKIDPQTLRVNKRGSSLSLAFCASMYCEYYRFWKDDGKDWNTKDIPDERQWWYYNCEDCVRTFECAEVLPDALQRHGLWRQYLFMMSLAGPVLDMMMRGMPFDRDRQREYHKQLRKDQEYVQQWIDTVCGHAVNTGSNGPNGQMQKLFYDDLGVKPVMKGRGRDARRTLDDTALELIATRNPALGPLCRAMSTERSLAHFDENILNARLREDGRISTEINLTGTETFRFSSTQDAFGYGMNLQNINRMPEE